jgi:hypothetical protein
MLRSSRDALRLFRFSSIEAQLLLTEPHGAVQRIGGIVLALAEFGLGCLYIFAATIPFFKSDALEVTPGELWILRIVSVSILPLLGLLFVYAGALTAKKCISRSKSGGLR